MAPDNTPCQASYFTKNEKFAIIFLHTNTTNVIQYKIHRGYQWLDQE